MEHGKTIYNNFEPEHEDEQILIENENEEKKSDFNFDKNTIKPIEFQFQEQSLLFHILDNYKNISTTKATFPNKKDDFNFDENTIKPIEFQFQEKSLSFPISDNHNLATNSIISNIPENFINEKNIIEETKIVIEIENKAKLENKEDSMIKKDLEDKKGEDKKINIENIKIEESQTKKEKINGKKIENVQEFEKDKIGNGSDNLEKKGKDKNKQTEKEKEEEDNINKSKFNEQNNIEEKEIIVTFIFDKEKINQNLIQNQINLDQSNFSKVFEEYKKKAYQEVKIDLNGLISQNILNKPLETFSENIIIKSYETNNLLSVSSNKIINKIKLEKTTFSEIENINNIIEGNKKINIFEEKENKMICQRPTIIQEDKEEETEEICFIKNFETMLNHKKYLYEKKFIFDSELSAEIIINNDKIEQISSSSSNYCFSSNQVYKSYINKNFRSYVNNSAELSEKKIILSIKEENEEIGTISGNNKRRLNKIKFVKIFQEPNIDNNRINICKGFFSSHFFERMEQNYEDSNIKSFQIQSDFKSSKINNDKYDNVITEIFYSCNNDKELSKRIYLNNELNQLDKTMENSIEDIHYKYSEKIIITFDLYNDYSQINAIEAFDDIDIYSITKKYEKFKEKKRKQKNKYLLGGSASLQLMKDSLSQESYNNSETALLHSMSLSLKKIDSAISNDELKIMGNFSDKALKSNNLRCAKKLKNELNRSLMNKYVINNGIEMKKNNSEKINKPKDINDINVNNSLNLYKSQSAMNAEKEKEKIMNKIKKINDDKNKSEKKKYINKLKIQQDNKFEQEIERESRKRKYIFPISVSIFFIIPFLINFYQKYTEI